VKSLLKENRLKRGERTVGKGKEKENSKKKPDVPGSGGEGAGAGGQGGGGGGHPDAPPRLRWEFDLPTEGADASWKGRAIWGKIDRGAIYVESSEIGSLGRVPAKEASVILRALETHKGRLHGEILIVKNSKLIRVELLLV
jgi:hypothetical protein